MDISLFPSITSSLFSISNELSEQQKHVIAPLLQSYLLSITLHNEEVRAARKNLQHF